jgi:hypothetical protein
VAVTISGTTVLDKSMSAIAVDHEDVRTRLCRGVEGEGENELINRLFVQIKCFTAKSLKKQRGPRFPQKLTSGSCGEDVLASSSYL